MRVYKFKPDTTTNFGDEINDWLWPRVIPDLDKREGVFYGIGTMLDSDMPADRPAVVFGSGAGYGPVPDLRGVDVRFVRGPRTAKVLGLSYNLAITDPAIILGGLALPPPVRDTTTIGFMPRWTQIEYDPTLPKRLADVGIHTIDPRWDVESVFDAISGCSTLITEALHGAILADTLRIPWIATYADQGHLFKWLDWCESMDVRYSPADLRVSPLRWIADNWEPQISPIGTCIYRRRQVEHEIERFNDELAG